MFRTDAAILREMYVRRRMKMCVEDVGEEMDRCVARGCSKQEAEYGRHKGEMKGKEKIEDERKAGEMRAKKSNSKEEEQPVCCAQATHRPVSPALRVRG